MSKQNVAHAYSPTEPESGVFPAAKPVSISSERRSFSICADEINGAANNGTERLALFEALVAICNAASRLSAEEE